MDKENQAKDQLKGKVYFIVFVVLIFGGIIHKRVFDGPEFMMVWHLPAAVFLVLSGKNLTRANRQRYYERRNQGLSRRA